MKLFLTYCLCTFTFLSISAQPKVPTKEETINFIRSHFRSGITTVSSEKTQKSFVSHTRKFSDFEFQLDATLLTVKFNQEYQYFYTNESLNMLQNNVYYSKYKVVIDLKQVESISFKLRKDPSGATEPVAYSVYLNFKAALPYSIDSYAVTGEKNIPSDRIRLPELPKKESELKFIANFFQAEADFDITTEGNNIKILKAFNHLRKLCGAPDPISFD